MAQSLSHSLIALLALPLAAQAVNESAPRFSFKMGTAPVIGTPGKQEARPSMLLAGEYSYPFWQGEFFATAEYRIFRANDYEVTRFGKDTGYATDGSGRRGMITPYVLAPSDGLPAP